jgi:hypothetical protein
VEVTYTPGGAAYVASKDDAPGFGNYGFGTSVTFNLNRFLGIEGEIGTMIATTSDLRPGWRASQPRRVTSRLASATMFSGVKPNFF